MYPKTSTNKLHEFVRGLIQDLTKSAGFREWKLEREKMSLIRAQYDPVLSKSPGLLTISMQAGPHYSHTTM